VTWDSVGVPLPDSGWCRPAADHRPGSKLVYAACTNDGGKLYAYVSTDDGGSFTRYDMGTYNDADDTQSYPSIQVAPDGTVWITTNLARGGEAGSDYTLSNRLMSSRDGGRTWRGGSVFLRHTIVGYGHTSFRSAFGESFGVGRRRIRGSYPLYFVFESPTAAGTTLFLTTSFDGGQHWRARVQVNDNRGPTEALQPSLTVAPNGVVAVAFYDRRLPCAASDEPDVTGAGLSFDPAVPFGRADYCVNTAIQFYRPGPALRPIGRNVRLSAHTWDPQLSAARFACICVRASFIGDYFGLDTDSQWAYTSSVTTFNDAGENPGFHQQQLVSRIALPSAR
jgi:hypothetical protein